jgi:hypothetical protein
MQSARQTVRQGSGGPQSSPKFGLKHRLNSALNIAAGTQSRFTEEPGPIVGAGDLPF